MGQINIKAVFEKKKKKLGRVWTATVNFVICIAAKLLIGFFISAFPPSAFE